MRATITAVSITLLVLTITAKTVCRFDVCPSGDMSGQTDTAVLRARLETDRYVTLAHGNYYFTQIDSQLGLVPILYDNTTIDGGDWNMTTLYMVGTETSPAADWYLFHIRFRDTITIRNLTIDGSLLETVAEQTHGAVIQESSNITLENVRGREIYGDTVKMAYACDNCQFLNTEHLSNGRSGIAMRGQPPIQATTNGGITIDGLLCIDVSDQCIDMETGITPGEMILSNGRVYASPDNAMCMAIVGELDGNGEPGQRVVMDNWQVYCKTYLFNAGQVIISNSIFDATAQGGTALLVSKASHDIILTDSIIAGDGLNGVIHLTVHNSGRPSHVLLSDLIIKASPPAAMQGVGIDIYDAANVAVNNVTIQTTERLYAGVRWRDVTAGIERGYFAVDGLRVNDAYMGVYVTDTTQLPVSMIDTLTVSDSHFSNTSYGIVLENPAYHSTPYVTAWDFSGNVYGAGVGTPVVIGGVFQ